MRSHPLGRRPPILVLLCTLGLGSAGSCKPKLDRSGPDGEAPATSTTGTPSAQEAKRACTRYLAAHVTRGAWDRTTSLIAFDAVQGGLHLHKKRDSLQVTGRASVFVRTRGGEDQKRMSPFGCFLARKNGRWTAITCNLGGVEVFRRKPKPDSTTAAASACDQLIRFMQCYASRLPKSQGAAMKNAFRKSIDAYRNALKNPATRAAILKSCGQALQAMRKSVSKMPKFKSCFEGG